MDNQPSSEPLLIPQIDVTEASNRVGNACMLLDVRTPEEYHAGHAPEATWIPLDDVAERAGELDRDLAILAICRAGGRSQKAAEILADLGFCTINVSGGMNAWAAAGLEVVTDDGSPGEVI